MQKFRPRIDVHVLNCKVVQNTLTDMKLKYSNELLRTIQQTMCKEHLSEKEEIFEATPVNKIKIKNMLTCFYFLQGLI